MGLAVLALAMCLSAVQSTELTFDMKPHDEECFFEEIEKGTDVTIEYQVHACEHCI